MAFISKGKSKSSHSGRSSGSDSEEQRLRANVNRFGLQQSSPTSASSSDSEHEEVSISSAGEKTAAPPALKKNPNSSDRSAVRTRSTPSEPNPNNPSASKAKKGVAAKRAKDDDFSEEQPESKKKKSVSEAKKAAAEDDDVDGEQSEPKKKSASKAKKGAVVKDDVAAEEKKSVSNGKESVSNGKKPVYAEIGASNPHKKKPRKERQESAEATAAKVSSKKTARVWKADDENVIMLRYLVCVREGLEYSKNMQQFFQKMNDSLVHKASHTQLYEKVRTMKKRYRSLKNKIAQTQGRIKEDVFVYKSPHEKELYKLWKQAWGEQHEADGDVMHRPSSEEDQFCGDEDEEEEEEVESDGGTDTDKEPKVPRTEKAMVWNHDPVRPPVASTPILNNESEDRSVPIMKEIMDMLAEVTREVRKMIETSEAELKALLRAN